MADFDYEEYGLTPLERPSDVKATSTGDDYYDNLTEGQRQEIRQDARRLARFVSS